MITSFLAIARIELRNLTRNGWRSILIGCLIGIPVSAMVAGGILVAITEATAEERTVAQLGVADLKVSSPLDVSQLIKKLPRGSMVEPFSTGQDVATAHGIRLNIGTRRQSVDGLATGILTMEAGTAPKELGEIAISRALANATGASVGSTLELSVGGNGQVVGMFVVNEQLDALEVLFPFVPKAFWGRNQALISLPESVTEDELIGIQSALSKEETVSSRKSAAESQSPLTRVVTLVGILGLAEAALIVSAAFIVSLRRRQREIGLLSSVGASRIQTLMAVLLNAIFISALAGLVAVVVGVLAAWVVYPKLDNWNQRLNGPFEVDPFSCLQAIFFGVITATLAAALPAWSAANMSVKSALSSRSPTPRSSGRWGILGVAMVFVGGSLVGYAPKLVDTSLGNNADNRATLMIMFGSICAMIGFAAASPWILKQAARPSAWLPLPARLSVREIGRFRTRNGPIVAAILAGMSLSVLIAAIFTSVRQLDDSITRVYEPEYLLVSGTAAENAAKRLISVLPTKGLAQIRLVVNMNGDLLKAGREAMQIRPRHIAVATQELLETLAIDPKANSILNDGGILRLKEPVAKSESDVLSGDLPTEPIFAVGSAELLAELLAKTNDSNIHLGSVGYLISQDVVDRYEWQSQSGMWDSKQDTWLTVLDTSVDAKLFAQASQLVSDIPQTNIDSQLNYGVDRRQIAGVFVLSLLTGLVIVAIATALASEEAAADQKILMTVGASPSVAYHQAAARAGFLTLLGSFLAAPAGLLPAYGMLSIIPQLDFVVPWFETTLAIVGLPCLSYASTWLWHVLAARFRGTPSTYLKRV